MSLSPPGVRLFYDPRGHHAGAINELCWGLEDAPLATGHVTDSDDHLRTLGANAGQLVKVLPLSERN